MGDVVMLDIPTRLDVPAERVLSAALEAGLESIIIAGFDSDGGEYFASSLADGGDALWLMERFKMALLKKADELTEAG